MADTKECQCNALNLLSRMSRLLDTWISSDMARAEVGLGKLINEMVDHLNARMAEPENEHIRETEKDTLDAINTKIMDANVGKVSNISGSEFIRSAIHEKPLIRGSFLCLRPNEAAESALNKEVYEALEVLENVGPLEAKALFDGISHDLTCGG